MTVLAMAIWCSCEHGTMFKTSITNNEGIPVMCEITSDEKILFRGYCSACGKEMEFSYPIMKLLFDCPNKRRKHD